MWKRNKMAQMIEITDFDAPELDVYARLTENQLINRHEPEKGMFIAESPKVIERALDAGRYAGVNSDGKKGILRERDRRFLRDAGRSRSIRRNLMYSRKLDGFN